MTIGQSESAALERYLSDHVETATPVQRLLMLFDYLGRDFVGARLAFAEGNLESINNRLIHAQEILAALRDPLDLTSDLGRSLASVYTYCLERLIAANFRKEVAPLDEVQPLIEEIASANRIAAAAMVRPAVPVSA